MKISLNFVSSLFFVLLLVSCTDTLQNEDSSALTFRGRLSGVTESELDRQVVKASAGGAELTVIRTARPMDSGMPTKGDVVTSLVGRTFSLNGYQYAAGEDWTSAKTHVSPMSLFHGRTVVFDANGSIVDGEMVYRGGSSKRMAFFGMGPLDLSEPMSVPPVLVSGEGKAGVPEYDVEIPAGFDAQADLLECVTVDVSGGGQDGVELSFGHALSGIRFTFEDFGVDALLKGVRLEGFCCAATRRVGESWSYSTDPSDRAPVDLPFNQFVPAAGSLVLNPDGKPFFVIPQELGADGSISLVFEVCGEDVDFTCPLEGFSFDAGKIYTFEFSVDPGDELYHVLSVDGGAGPGIGQGSLGLAHAFGPAVSTKAGGELSLPAHLSGTENIGGIVYSYALFSSGMKLGIPWEVVSYKLVAQNDTTGEEVLETVSSLEELGVTVLTSSGTGNPYGDAFCFTVAGDSGSSTKAGPGFSYVDSRFFVDVRNAEGDEGSFLVKLEAGSGSETK